MLAVAAISARSVAPAGFGLDSLIEIGDSAVVIRELSGTGEDPQRRALKLIGVGVGLLTVYLLVQSTWVPAAGFRPHHSPLGIGWTAVTAAVLSALAAGKARPPGTCWSATRCARSRRSSATTDSRDQVVAGPAGRPVRRSVDGSCRVTSSRGSCRRVPTG
ncbi:hypothetical protein GCM10014715_82060 [Streptomyces spiralis]|uniref:Uncharacterized protein n=1 Tax=Streptomyces spiralis TaxID=66376 RepID=A0A919AKS2_9ACTN|nr:hypothetical protein GCM10014715_82060 [Streptomyces spiralis]